MGFLDAILGRSKPVRPDLDRLFALPSAALTVQAETGFLPTGSGSVCFASVEGGAFLRLQDDIRGLLDVGTRNGGVPVEFVQDGYGYSWVLVRHPADDTVSLVNDLHAINTLLQDAGFGPHLLCSLVAFADEVRSRPLGLVYLYKRGAFYPFAPLPGAEDRRDTPLELQIRALLDVDLPMEPDLARWFPLWGAPGLEP
ncbi:hypothetical protein ACFQ61_35855 [Streptomyces sp. NPDC056500]|uniref:PspA-associated protein PspAB n=1 Tax=Streptomyces sp. NPDC056500 TaxID=3345840 RepID=UPI00369E0EC0